MTFWNHQTVVFTPFIPFSLLRSEERHVGNASLFPCCPKQGCVRVHALRARLGRTAGAGCTATGGRRKGAPHWQLLLGVSHATIDFVIESVSRVSKLEIENQRQP